MRVLFTTPILEHPPAGGPQLRIENSIKALARVSDLFIVSRAPRMTVGVAGARYYRSLVRGYFSAPGTEPNRYVRKLRRLIFDRGAANETESSTHFILQLVDRLEIDVVWFGYGNISFDLIAQVRAQRPNLRMVCDTDSVWSRFVLRELPFEPDPAKRRLIEEEGQRKQAEERAWVDLCDVTTAVSEVDADFYRSIASEPARIHVFSNGIDLENYRGAVAPPAGFARPSLYLAGTFGRPDSPMDRAGRWVIEEVLPRVRRHFPEVRLYLVGRESDTSFADVQDPAVVATGKLPSVLPYLANADVALVPLQFESGTRFKILEAAAVGTPIVSTVLGAEGLPVVDGEHILLADEPGAFAEAIGRVITDRSLAERLARNCRKLVEKEYGIPALAGQAAGILRYLEG